MSRPRASTPSTPQSGHAAGTPGQRSNAGRRSGWSATEHDEQAALFRWAAFLAPRRPELRLLFAIPNGGARDARTAAKMKAEGVRPGVPDVCLPVARTGPDGRTYGALWLEVKRPAARALFEARRAGTLRPEQRAWLEALSGAGQAAIVAHGFEAARAAIEAYLDGAFLLDGDRVGAWRRSTERAQHPQPKT